MHIYLFPNMQLFVVMEAKKKQIIGLQFHFGVSYSFSPLHNLFNM